MKYLRNFYVPCVVKSKEYLIGYLDSLHALSDVLSFSPWIFDSTKFNDYLPNDTRRSENSDEEIVEIMNEFRESLSIKENEKDEIKEDVYFELNCSCGNYHAFYYAYQIPESDFKCDLCDRLLIDYTGHYDEEFEYDGDVNRMTIGLVENDLENEDSEEDDE